jgi:hypothetical protein
MELQTRQQKEHSKPFPHSKLAAEMALGLAL